MKWLEIIKLRTGQNLDNIVNKFIRPLTKDYEGAGLITMIVYSHATLNTDLSIHLYWDTAKVSQQKTLLSSCIINILEDFGLIHYTIWIAQKNNFESIKQGDLNIG